MAQDGAKIAQDDAKTAQDGAKIAQDDAKTEQYCAKTGQDGARTCQDGAKTCQDGAKACQDGGKTGHNGAKMGNMGAPEMMLALKVYFEGSRGVHRERTDSLTYLQDLFRILSIFTRAARHSSLNALPVHLPRQIFSCEIRPPGIPTSFFVEKRPPAIAT